MNRELKAEVIRRFGSQGNFSRAVGITEWKISRIIHQRAVPSEEERARLNEIFGARRARQLLRPGHSHTQD